MITTVSRWGNSLGIRIPKDAAEEAHLREGDAVQVISEDGRLMLVPVSTEPTLDDLIEMITPENCHAEAVVVHVGAEVW